MVLYSLDNILFMIIDSYIYIYIYEIKFSFYKYNNLETIMFTIMYLRLR